MKNLRIMNAALLIKHLHKFYNKEDVPWVQLIWNTHYAQGQVPHASTEKGSFWFKDIMKFADNFRGIAAATIGPGDTTLLWSNVWNGNFLEHSLPRLYSFAKNKKVSVAQYINNQDVQVNFHLPFSKQALEELHSLNLIMQEATQQQQEKDVWTYIWGSKQYTSSKFYSLSFQAINPPKPFLWIWKMKLSKKIKIFIWLMFRDRLNSRNLLRRKNYKLDGDDFSCVLCNPSTEEYTYHLFFQCHFSVQCWAFLGIHWDHSLYFFDTIQQANDHWQHKFFMEIFSVAAWEIWKQRNAKIFRNTNPTFDSRKHAFLSTIRTQMYRIVT